METSTSNKNVIDANEHRNLTVSIITDQSQRDDEIYQIFKKTVVKKRKHKKLKIKN